MSWMSQLAVLVYGLVMLACLAAVRAAAPQSDRRGDLYHWLACIAAFAGMIALRVGQVEDRSRDAARGWAQQAGEYQSRFELQLPVVLLMAALGLVIAYVFIRLWRASRRGSRARLVLLSRFAVLGLVPLFGLRLASLHQIDRVLYSGPLRINWMIEGVICVVVGGCAALYFLRIRGRGRR